MSTMLTRRQQIAAKIESNEGTAESLAAADAALLVYTPKINFEPGMFERDPVRTNFSSIGKVVGKLPGTATFKVELRGSGTAATAPGWSKLLQACGFTVNVLNQISIGAITSGPFQHGETITGGTSTATGRVVISTATGAAVVYFVILSGTFQSGEVITGGTSSATATTSSTPSVVGNELKPITTAISSLTIGSYEDGVKKVIRGARGTVKFSLKAGEPGMMDFSFKGVSVGVSDLALLSGINYEITKPPAFLSAALKIDAYSTPHIGEIDLDVANTLAERDDVNDAGGILSYGITGRKITGSINPEMVTVATYDFYGKWLGGTTAIMDFTIGATAGNKFRFYAPALQHTKIDDEDKSGIKVAKCSFDLNGSVEPGNDELVILAM